MNKNVTESDVEVKVKLKEQTKNFALIISLNDEKRRRKSGV